MTRYLKITQTDGARYILRVTRESSHLVSGIEVDAAGDEVVPRGVDPVTGQPWHQRERHVPRAAIKKAVEMRMNPKYATLEVVPRQASAKKTSAQLDAEIAEALAGRSSGARALYWEQRYSKATDLSVGDVILSGSVPPYTAYEVTQIDPAPRRRLRLSLVRLPDRDHGRQSVLRPTDTVAVPAGQQHHAEIYGESREPRTDRATKTRIPDEVRAAIEQQATEFIDGSYRRYALVGGREPCVTVGLMTDYLRQAHMPENFRWATKDRQRTWTRSVLESMRRRGQIGSSFGAKARCYEPKR